MTLYWIKPLRGVLNLQDESFEPDVAKQPPGTIAIDRFAVDPSNTTTQIETASHDYREMSVLHLSAWDAAMVVALCVQIGILQDSKGKPLPARFVSLFHGNPVDGLKSLIRTTFPNLAANGENSYYRNRQLSGPNRADWAKLHKQARLDAATARRGG